MTTWFALLLCLGALRFIPGSPRDEKPWKARYEIGLALLLGVVFSVLACGWFSRFHLTGPTLSSDFYDFCSAVAHARNENWSSYSQDRSFLAGWLPALFAARVGVVEGLAWSAAISSALIGTGLYVWARSLHSRMAGIYTLIFALGIAPIVVLGRTLTFYPQYIGWFCLSAGLCAAAVRFRNWWTLAAATASIGMCLLIDVRGVVWAAPNLALLLLFYLPQPKKQALIGMGIILTILAGFWWGGSRAYSPDHTSLDDQANPIRLHNEHKPVSEPLLSDPGPAGIPNFVWGRTPLQDIPKTLFLLGRDTKKVAPGLAQVTRTQRGRAAHFHPWYPLVGTLTLVFLIAPGPRRARIATLLLTASPFLVVLYHASTLEFRPRFAASALPPFAVLLGLGTATLWATGRKEVSENSSRSARLLHQWPSALRVGLLAVFVFGAIPSFLAPDASWRQRFVSDQEVQEMRRGALGGRQPEAWGSEACVEGIRDDWRSGKKPLGRLYY